MKPLFKLTGTQRGKVKNHSFYPTTIASLLTGPPVGVEVINKFKSSVVKQLWNNVVGLVKTSHEAFKRQSECFISALSLWLLAHKSNLS